jgi:uncharacterized protein (TIGR02391 family)
MGAEADPELVRLANLRATGEQFSYPSFAGALSYHGYPAALSQDWAYWTARVQTVVARVAGIDSPANDLVKRAQAIELIGWGDDHFENAKSLFLAALRTAEEGRAEASHMLPSDRALRAYQGLNLHPEIARAASNLYQGGHYANAVEAAVKALNGLVRLRGDLEIDGSALMEKAFSPKGPVLAFNALASQSDRDEQRGFMMLFSGAVAGLRNPRAHGFINDDPERALEFIAFVSLLAKLLDGAAAATAVACRS